MSESRPNEDESAVENPFCAEIRDLLPAYALDALPHEEAVFVERHVDVCPDCAAELEAFRSAAGSLALAVPLIEPPASLKKLLLERAAAEKPGSSAPPTPAAERGRPRLVAPVWGAIAASVVVSAGSLYWASNLQAQLNRVQGRAERYDQVVKVLASDSLNTKPLQAVNTDNHYYGTLWLDPNSRMGMVTVRGLPKLTEDRAWQVWFVRTDGTRVGGGMLRTDPNGSCYAVLELPPGDPSSFVSFGITEEPASGSPAPTTPRVLGASLS